jgi:predicted GNAT family N-acyltransferase
MKTNPNEATTALLIRAAEETDLPTIFDIRKQVFVLEQGVDPEEEYDEFETSAVHLIALWNQKAVGTARFRSTEKGWKIERMAVLANFRKLGIGRSMLQEALLLLPKDGRKVYLHAQEHALGFYESTGFSPTGNRFFEANIPHFLCELIR